MGECHFVAASAGGAGGAPENVALQPLKKASSAGHSSGVGMQPISVSCSPKRFGGLFRNFSWYRGVRPPSFHDLQSAFPDKSKGVDWQWNRE